MTYDIHEEETSTIESNERAEDGPKRSPWNACCEAVIIPLGSLFVIFLAMLGLMLIAD
jgi:hypothetical protein